MVDSTLAYRRDFLMASPGVTVKETVQCGGVRWKCLEQSLLMLNTDASMRAGYGASIGEVLLYRNVCEVWCFSKRCCTTAVSVTEAIAIRHGLQYDRDQGVRYWRLILMLRLSFLLCYI